MSSRSRLVLTCAAVGEAVGVGAGFDDVAAEGEAVDSGVGGLFGQAAVTLSAHGFVLPWMYGGTGSAAGQQLVVDGDRWHRPGVRRQLREPPLGQRRCARAPAAPCAGVGVSSASAAFSSIESILVTLTKSSSSAREQAVLTGASR